MKMKKITYFSNLFITTITTYEIIELTNEHINYVITKNVIQMQNIELEIIVYILI
jgi:hypothetical protein